MKTNSILPIVIVLGGALVAVSVYAHVIHNYSPSSSATQNVSAIRPVDVQDHIYGNPNAPVKIVEYSDFDCSSCGEFQHTLERIMHDYGPTGEVAWVFRELPLTKIHPTALKIARAAECVAKTAGNGAFWKFADLMFANQPVNPTKLGQYITAVGGDPEEVARCVMNGSVNARLENDRANALSIGVNGVPYTFIIGSGAVPVIVKGADSYSPLKQEIATMLIIASSSPEQ